MPKLLCLFSMSCIPSEHLIEGCPFHMERMTKKRGFISPTCSTWNKVYESNKERRIRYAQEAERRRAFSGSEGQNGAIAVGEGHKRLEAAKEKEIGQNVDVTSL